MKKMAAPKLRTRAKKSKAVKISKRGRPKAKLATVPRPFEWPDFESRITKLRPTKDPVRDIIDELREERV